jgi:hypothetical protein
MVTGMSKIIIEDPILEGRKLVSRATTSKQLEKYLLGQELFIEYDVDVDVDESMLNIPLTATLLPVAWVTGSDLYVKTIDKTFKESMGELHKFFSKMFPKIPTSTKIITEKLVENKIKPKDPQRRTGLLFSGGIDSYYSLINNIDHNPKLIMIWGVDDFPYPERAEHWEKTIETYREYAERKNLELFILKTNISQIINDRRLWHKYFKELYYGAIRSTLGHSTVLLGPTAPISIGRFDRLVIAASNSVDYDYKLRPNGAHPDADEKIIWGDLKVQHDGLGSRYEKIKTIVDFHGDDDYVIRVCSRSAFVDGKFNDNRCNKCFNTILRLILNGHDPNEHGFIANESTFEFLKTRWKNRGFRTRRSRGWKNMQGNIPDRIDFDVNGSKDFFEWLRGLDIEVEEREKYIFFTDLYMWLPFRLAEILRYIYGKLEIRTQGWGFNPIYARTLKQQKPDDN